MTDIFEVSPRSEIKVLTENIFLYKYSWRHDITTCVKYYNLVHKAIISESQSIFHRKFILYDELGSLGTYFTSGLKQLNIPILFNNTLYIAYMI